MLRRVVSNRLVRKQCISSATSSSRITNVNNNKNSRFIHTSKFSSSSYTHTKNTPTTTTFKPVVTMVVRQYASLPSGLSELKMPALSPTMEKGNIITWRVKEGDKIGPGDVLCEIETDKAKLEFEFQEEGYVAKILRPEDSKDVLVGDTIAIVAESKDDVAQAANITAETLSSGSQGTTQQQQSSQPSQQQPQEQQQQQPEQVSESASLPSGVSEIKMPALSPTMQKGNIVRWNKKEGDKLSPGDVLCQVETDKSTMDFEFQEDGFLAKILVPEGTQDVELFSVIALLAEDKDSLASAASYTPGAAIKAKPSSSAQPQQQQQQQQQQSQPQQQQPVSQKASGDRVFASPLAKKVANESGVQLSNIGSGSGPNGRIIKSDVDQFVASGKQSKATTSAAAAPTTTTTQKTATTTTSGEFRDIPVSNVRKVIANRLLESKQTIPHYYLSVECEIDELMKVRSELNKKGEKRGYKLSVNDFLIKASAASMKKVPAVNSSWRDTFIREYNNVDVSVAVQTDNGLITPIVFNAESKGLADISSNVKSLAEKARNGKLQPQEFQGGTFTISNLGMFGVNSFSAIINPPQAAILAVGAAQQKVVLNPSFEKDQVGEKFKVVTTIQVTLSCDHRVVDGAVGAQWLQEFKTFVEDPVMLLL